MWQDYDRDSYSDSNSPRNYGGQGRPTGFGFQRPPVTPTVKILLMAMVGVFILQTLVEVAASADAANSFLQLFGVSWDGAVKKLYLWQFGTYIFLHGGIFHLLMNMLWLWMFGGDVENGLGRRKFLQLFLLGGVFAGLSYVIFAAFDPGFVPAVGASGALMAVVVVFTMRNPNQSVLLFMMIPMKMWHMMVMIIGIDLYYAVTNDANGVANTAHLGGALFGYLWFRFGPRLDQVFVRIEKDQKVKEYQREVDARAEVDRLLEKIARDGMHSLTGKERKFLKQASRRFYD